jgi:hypothetical protein
MKNLYLTIIVIFSISSRLIGQTDQIQLDKTKSVKESIKKEIPSLTKIEKIKNDDGEKFVYLKNQEIVLITVHSRDKNIDKYVEWYYSKNELFYSEQTWINSSTGEIINNEKFYLLNRQLIALQNTDQTFETKDSDKFKTLNAQLAEYGSSLINQN